MEYQSVAMNANTNGTVIIIISTMVVIIIEPSCIIINCMNNI